MHVKHYIIKKLETIEEDRENYLKKTDINYLRSYFKEGKTYFMLHYRRKIEERFRHVVMEMIPAEDYSLKSQMVYLYVKDIDDDEL